MVGEAGQHSAIGTACLALKSTAAPLSAILSITPGQLFKLIIWLVALMLSSQKLYRLFTQSSH